MNDEINVPVNLPLDSDGFLRRECPSCEQEFKWFHHVAGDPDAESVTRYFCPLCGNAASTDSWWTPAQLEYISESASPEIEQAINDTLRAAFQGIQGMKVESGSCFALDHDVSKSLVEPDDMIAVEPPCHPNEPLKVPESSTNQVFCLVCGQMFAA